MGTTMCSPVQGPAGKTATQVAGASGGGSDVAGVSGGGGDSLAAVMPQLTAILDSLKQLISSLGSLGLGNAVAGATGEAEASGGGPADAKGGVEQMGGCPHMKGKGDMPAYIPPPKVGGENGDGEPTQKGKVAGEHGDGDEKKAKKHKRRGHGHHHAPGKGHDKHGCNDDPAQVPTQGKAPKDSDVGGKSGPPAKGDPTQDGSDVGGAKGDGDDVGQTPPAKGDPSQDGSDVGGANGDGDDVGQNPPAKGDPSQDGSDVGGANGSGDDVSQDDAPAKGDDVSQDGSDVGGSNGSGAPDKGDVSQDDTDVAGDSGSGVGQTDGAGGKSEEPPVKNVGDVKLTESDGSNELWLRAADGSFLQFGSTNVTYISATGRPTYASIPKQGVAIELSDGTRVSIGMVGEGEWNERAGTPRDIEIISADGADFVAARTDDAENTYDAATPLTAYHLIEIASVLANGEYAAFGDEPTQK